MRPLSPEERSVLERAVAGETWMAEEEAHVVSLLHQQLRVDAAFRRGFP